MAEHKSLELHIAMFPWLAVGHITPFLHLSNELAKRGHRITFLLPKKAQIQLQHLNLHPNLITFHPLTIPHFDGLPHGTETASDIPIHLTHLLAVAMDRTRDQVENFLRATIPDMVFYDNAHWIPEITRQLGIKAVCNNVVSAAALAIALVPARVVPKARALSFIALPFGDGITFYDRVITAMKESDVISIRTCKEIEGNLCDYMANQFGKSVFLTGPVLPELVKKPLEETWAKWLDGFEKFSLYCVWVQNLEKNQFQDLLGFESTGLPELVKKPLEETWAKWLDGFEPSSVLYCAFGSQIILEKNQFQELLLGFESTGFPFLIALKPPMGCSTIEEALPEGFEERVKERGRVYGGWVEQPLILSHPSVGCFVSHCGFGSMWEFINHWKPPMGF
uniref:Glycosyltransferase N-terminal domain-containing protein n=1 Tax=Fagus sylvatica TaxID=28930 RepID=A0A2N9G4Y1_FAGSY